MNSKNVELNAAKEKLAKLIDHLYVLEREYDKALEHAASYLGYDEKIEKVRDERASGLYENINEVKNQIMNQTKLIEALVADY
ncbi:hypothetical protein M4D07_11690 [Klebsiella pneumoniae]|uniref:hypothetical protein n=1 Tax=Klebsiella TaxID=570 RepID=UPI0007608522|nr:MULTISPECIES: hypothetical protein [Klebsiella]HBQ6064443.1 hypothetical protein [Klebsiella pneumoniae subsp. pneumoniae]HCI6528608.1 hypothetical protein [Klebsiella quasipneumoniae subsp. quasipneumoniae]HDH1396384.1 hypothetical protein [Klebsiella quasipneumoniae subsp. similipneumoniae]HDS7131458.1 hypothetical protein [Klebsiella pneumoniae subsp. ozaenae]AUU93899.1 hypothetical protein C2U49_03315 [Klebsiella pneumoniae]